MRRSLHKNGEKDGRKNYEKEIKQDAFVRLVKNRRYGSGADFGVDAYFYNDGNEDDALAAVYRI